MRINIYGGFTRDNISKKKLRLKKNIFIKKLVFLIAVFLK